MKNKQKGGFTLTEVLVATAIIVGLIALVYKFQGQMTEVQTSLLASHFSSQLTNNLLNQQIKEIRNAQFGASQNYPLVTIDPNEIIFYSDYDYDNVVERVRYTVNGQELEKGTINPDASNQYLQENEQTRILTEELNNGEVSMFTYYDGDGNESSNLSEIRLIKVDINIDDYQLTSSAQIRVLKDN